MDNSRCPESNMSRRRRGQGRRGQIGRLHCIPTCETGASVGLLDGDIYGPSGHDVRLDELQPTAKGNILDPFDAHGVKCMSIAKLVDPEKAMIWRGPMAHKAFSNSCSKPTGENSTT